MIRYCCIFRVGVLIPQLDILAHWEHTQPILVYAKHFLGINSCSKANAWVDLKMMLSGIGGRCLHTVQCPKRQSMDEDCWCLRTLNTCCLALGLSSKILPLESILVSLLKYPTANVIKHCGCAGNPVSYVEAGVSCIILMRTTLIKTDLKQAIKYDGFNGTTIYMPKLF